MAELYTVLYTNKSLGDMDLFQCNVLAKDLSEEIKLLQAQNGSDVSYNIAKQVTKREVVEDIIYSYWRKIIRDKELADKVAKKMLNKHPMLTIDNVVDICKDYKATVVNLLAETVFNYTEDEDENEDEDTLDIEDFYIKAGVL